MADGESEEKLLAALRGGIKTVLIPKRTPRILSKSRTASRVGSRSFPVSRMDEVLVRAMTRKPEPIESDETPTAAVAVPEVAAVEEKASTLTAH